MDEEQEEEEEECTRRMWRDATTTTAAALVAGGAVAAIRRRRRNYAAKCTGDEQQPARLSVIICTRNEETNIGRTLLSIGMQQRRRRRRRRREAGKGDGVSNVDDIGESLLPLAEVIVVDGGSEDDTVRIARRHGAKVMRSAPRRSEQLNDGAAAATGEVLLFLHGDVELPPSYRRELHRAVMRGCATTDVGASDSWGAFKNVHIDDANNVSPTSASPASRAPSALSLAIVEIGIALRTEVLSMPYGDQGIWMTRRVFDEEGGFPKLSFMEDYEMVQRLKSRHGRPKLIRAGRNRRSRIVVSGRRWRKLGVLKTFLVNQAIIFMHHCGVAPDKLRHLYYKF